eukprot:CAMPEP_0183304858 /NCGR_PEP_ID=MMETSP0160_2-20130417/9794_1 /TAXON_ID=2839 ORGANISM="Odontella Sinensis, Strain Grunow 1884" /NCGR_SAMPLE_ID=MMETSP0160_2 /ASSEMBLY_ACC=CAM_ASM_000250 /LENGTH=577 /DNA_ID=CAMNT_0025467977 /DNA_START=138 /DNA_END=1868 /DNA_ORIENTATION=-
MSPREQSLSSHRESPSSSGFETTGGSVPILSFRAKRNGPRCPFGNDTVSFDLRLGGCVCLSGNSGAGKTTLAMHIAGLSSATDLGRLDIRVESCLWDPSFPVRQRCGVLFQQTALVDALTVAGNVCVALEACDHEKFSSSEERDRRVKQLIEAVGLDYAKDGPKRPAELSGGMARRASLALQLAQKKHIIVLDEPFTGLDHESAMSVAKELVHIRKSGTALLLISHEPEIAAAVMDPERTEDNTIVTLEPPPPKCTKTKIYQKKPSLFGKNLRDRFLEKLGDYFLYSLPLILLTFTACGLAISMLSSDILRRVNVTEPVLEIINREVKPLLKLVTGQDEASPLTMMMINMKVKGMLNDVVPGTKAKLYAMGMAKLFVLEIGPLVTALLLSGRIGGSYAGEVATMQATAQNKLLQTLGINPRAWTLVPAGTAGVIAAPMLTLLGTALALFLGGIVGPLYEIGTYEDYMTEVHNAVFPSLRLRTLVAWEEAGYEQTFLQLLANLDLRTPFSNSYWDSFIEILTYPLCFLFAKSVTYICIIMIVAEMAARWKRDLTPRGVPGVITSSVVLGSLLVIVADW